jgi:hypothetical protein
MAQDCKPEQRNNCEKVGVGPNCSRDEKAGPKQKTQCLDEAKEACEEKLKDCIKKCKDEDEENSPKVTGYSGFKDADTSDGNAFLLNLYVGSAGNLLRENGVAQSAAQYAHGDNFTGAPGADLSIRDKMTLECQCTQDCYSQAISDCQTVQCYCGSFRCEGPDQTRNADGSGGGKTPGDNGENSFTQRQEKNELTEVTFNTLSKYDDPIEIVIGRAFLSGNVIWMSPPRSVATQETTTSTDIKTRTVTNKVTTTVKTVIDIQIALCAGEVSAIKSVFVDLKVLPYADILFSKGTSRQKVSSLVSSNIGFGRVPANRDIAIYEIRGADISGFRNFPEFSFEVTTDVKNIVSENTATSPAISGVSTSDLWTVDPLSRRMFTYSGSNLFCIDTSNMQTVWTRTVPGVREVTQKGNAIVHDSSSFRIMDTSLSSFQSNPLVSSQTGTALLHVVDQNLSGGEYLYYENGTTGYLQQVDDVYLSFPSDTVATQSFNLVGSTPFDLLLTANIARSINHPRHRSFFRFGVEGSSIVIREFRMFGQAADNLIEDGLFYTYTLPFSTLGLVNILNIESGFFDESAGLFCLFVSTDIGSKALGWSPYSGLIWKRNITTAPKGGKYASSYGVSGSYSFLSGSSLNVMDTTTGVVVSTPATFSNVSGKQFYDAARDEILYTSGSTITKFEKDNITYYPGSISSGLEALLQRVGLSPGDYDIIGLSGVIKGYRSGNQTFVSDILASIASLYRFNFFASDKLTITPMDSVATIAVSLNHVESVPTRKRSPKEASKSKNVRVSYLSDVLKNRGTPSKQHFRVDTGGHTSSTQEQESSFDWTALESASYMKHLAEILSTTSTDQNREVSMMLAPRYLRITPSDFVQLGTEFFAVNKVSVGADYSVSVEGLFDNPTKYQDTVLLSPPIILDNNTADFSDENILAPAFTMVGRPNPPTHLISSNLFLGLSGNLQSVESVQKGNVALTEDAAFGSIVPRLYTREVLWGRLIVPPVFTTGERFRTFPEQNLMIEFASNDMVTAVLSKQSRVNEYPDYRTISPNVYNMLLVNKELIQYAESFAVSGFPRRVEFRNLLRGRENTDDRMSHTVGEPCLIYDGVSTQQHEVLPERTAFSIKTLMQKDGEDDRYQYDVSADEEALYPVDFGYLMRYDVTATDSGVAGSLAHPANPHLFIMFRMRQNRDIGFTDNNVSLQPSGASMPFQLYLIRGIYDEVLFDTERDSTDTSYVFYRKDVRNAGLSAFSSKNYDLTTRQERGVVLYGVGHQGYDAENDTLTAVAIVKNEFGESRAVFSWPPGFSSLDRPRRGQRVK